RHSGSARPQSDRYHGALHTRIAPTGGSHHESIGPAGEQAGAATGSAKEITVARPAFELAGIFRQYGPAYRQTRPLPRAQLRVMRAIEVCRTAVLGGHVEKCSQCDFTRI